VPLRIYSLTPESDHYYQVACLGAFFVATSNIPLSTPDHVSNATTPSHSALHTAPNSRSAPQSPSQSKLDSLRSWSFNTYKFTRQLLSERLGRGTRTVDAELEAQIELLRDTQLKYANILRLARALTTHFYQVCLDLGSCADTVPSLLAVPVWQNRCFVDTSS